MEMDLARENDCNDFAPPIHPDAEELCDGLDNNCDEELMEMMLQIAPLGM